MCHSARIQEKEPTPHHCFQNWNGPSTAMESDIIVDGFKHSFEMHNIIFSKYTHTHTHIHNWYFTIIHTNILIS